MNRLQQIREEFVLIGSLNGDDIQELLTIIKNQNVEYNGLVEEYNVLIDELIEAEG